MILKRELLLPDFNSIFESAIDKPEFNRSSLGILAPQNAGYGMLSLSLF
jgi:hypothetical protein